MSFPGKKLEKFPLLLPQASPSNCFFPFVKELARMKHIPHFLASFFEEYPKYMPLLVHFCSSPCLLILSMTLSFVGLHFTVALPLMTLCISVIIRELIININFTIYSKDWISCRWLYAALLPVLEFSLVTVCLLTKIMGLKRSEMPSFLAIFSTTQNFYNPRKFADSSARK